MIEERKISFEEIVHYIYNREIIDRVDHPDHIKHRGYYYIVPFVENDAEYFLKTIIPSRKKTKEYSKKNKETSHD